MMIYTYHIYLLPFIIHYPQCFIFINIISSDAIAAHPSHWVFLDFTITNNRDRLSFLKYSTLTLSSNIPKTKGSCHHHNNNT